MVTAQHGVEPLEVGVPAGDDGRRLIAAAGLDDVDGVQLQGDSVRLTVRRRNIFTDERRNLLNISLR